jgi:hypothetical protein
VLKVSVDCALRVLAALVDCAVATDPSLVPHPSLDTKFCGDTCNIVNPLIGYHSSVAGCMFPVVYKCHPPWNFATCGTWSTESSA